MFEPIVEPKSLSRYVETKLTEAIKQVQYRPFQKISTEQELCSIFTVSVALPFLGKATFFPISRFLIASLRLDSL